MPARPTLLCAVDLSERAAAAVDATRWLARSLDATVVVAHAFDALDVPMPLGTEPVDAEAVTAGVVRAERARAEQWLARIALRLDGVESVVDVLEGPPVDALLALAAERRAALLVTGTRASGTLGSLMAGSVSAALAVRAPCPVCVVAPGAAIGAPGPVVAGYDGSDHGLRAARHGAALAVALGRGLILAHVTGKPEDRGVRADAELARTLHAASRAGRPQEPAAPLDVRIVIRHGDPVAELARLAHDRSAALVVTGTRGRGAIAAAVLGSVSAGLVRGARRPVVVVPASAGDAR